MLVHQLRNRLAALRTFGQLRWRRLEADPRNRPLVEGLLAEERQLNRYVDALAALGSAAEAAPVPYTHLPAHATKANLVSRLLLEKK